jgi:TPR repeat protein
LRLTLASYGLLTGIVLVVVVPFLVAVSYLAEQRQPDLSPERIIAASQGAFAPALPPAEDLAVLEQAAEQGIALAQNNLAVILLRTRDSRNHDRADRLLEAAAAQGLVQARYNIAYRIPYRFNTDPALVERQIDLLQRNMAEGDVHSMALLAARLGFVNRERFVEDRQADQLALLQRAAATQDPDYLFQYGAELWDRVRNMPPTDHTPARLVVMELALEAFLASFEQGEPRAAQRISAMIAERNVGPLTDGLAELGLPTNDLEWLDLAGQAGLAYADCHYAREVLGDLWPDDLMAEPLYRISAGIVQNALTHPPEQRQRALELAEACATPPQPPEFRPRAFGDTALYLAKYRGGWPAMGDSRGQADVMLGVIAALGVFGPVDRKKAAFHFDRAVSVHDYQGGVAFLDRLD